jgi:hypothetical protein
MHIGSKPIQWTSKVLKIKLHARQVTNRNVKNIEINFGGGGGGGILKATRFGATILIFTNY